ncbi:MAG: hypothetical protein QF890_01815 [Myxococcota bacterium]|jgi:hypothetical protein|nr:hypothetical protein [Deltaproteobacteria bacterium]MCP4241249.1 hypothetical protein [bacterium]MDP6074711.1 hypothetical protein [Myxococcota bacterium]MDP6243645.1 hypothetical protein [Myxococcota bacterium]MDP7073047.1 hypothetical protein [Myxococcota bacterium]|tara:strand:+ start:186 stop:524 length:339 start_codon:yes stop_codon:yes gene_type:complete
MLPLFAALTVAVTAADHWTTYLCLRAPVEGWQVTEGNPLASWLFSSIGLLPGIAFDSAVTLCALFFLVTTDLLPRLPKLAILGFIMLWTSWAVFNNLAAIHALGFSVLGTGS